MIIGISGKKGSGKDTLGNEIFKQFEDCHKTSFAYPVKHALQTMFGIPQEYLESQELKETWVCPVTGKNPRELMQLLGHSFGRKLIDNDVWVKALLHRLENLNKNKIKNVIITDVRYENEAETIRNLGGIIIHVKNPNEPDTTEKSHPSESGIFEAECDEIFINNKDLGLENVNEYAKRIVAKYQGKPRWGNACCQA